MMWYYASNSDSMYANNQVLCDSWGGAIVGGNFAYNNVVNHPSVISTKTPNKPKEKKKKRNKTSYTKLI